MPPRWAVANEPSVRGGGHAYAEVKKVYAAATKQGHRQAIPGSEDEEEQATPAKPGATSKVLGVVRSPLVLLAA